MMPMVMIVRIAQQPRTDDVDAKPEHRDRYGFAIRNGDGMNEPDRALVGDLNRDHRKDDRTGEGCEIAELPGTKGEPGIACMLTGKQVSDASNAKRGGMGRHVPA